MVAVPASHGLPERGMIIANLLRATIGCAFELLEPVRITLATFHRLARVQKERERKMVEMTMGGARGSGGGGGGDVETRPSPLFDVY